VGVEYAKLGNGLAGAGKAWEGGQWLAAGLPGWTPYDEFHHALYQSRYLSDSGRLFFDSSDALVAQDVNNNQDVYEFEPVGVGSCTSDSATYSSATQGCASLISSGRADGESAFLEASASRGDVFFMTYERLTDQDVDNALDLYDAHVCTATLPCPSQAAVPPPCSTADSCRSAPSPQPAIFASPSSATFSGVGNVVSTPASSVRPKSVGVSRAQKLAGALRACRKKRDRHKRAACEASARKHYGPRKATHANSKGRK
jgi:hypothetical protein